MFRSAGALANEPIAPASGTNTAGGGGLFSAPRAENNFFSSQQKNQSEMTLRERAMAKFGKGIQLTPGQNPFGAKAPGMAPGIAATPVVSNTPVFNTPAPAAVAKPAGSGFFGSGNSSLGSGNNPVTPFGQTNPNPSPFGVKPAGMVTPSPFGVQPTAQGGFGTGGKSFGSAPAGPVSFGAPKAAGAPPSASPFGAAPSAAGGFGAQNNNSTQQRSFGSGSAVSGQNPFGQPTPGAPNQGLGGGGGFFGFEPIS